ERPHIRWTGEFVAALGYSVAFASTICFLLQMSAQRHMSSARAALIFCFEPLFAALTSWLVLGERLAPLQWLGGGLIVLGMLAADLPAASRRLTGSRASKCADAQTARAAARMITRADFLELARRLRYPTLLVAVDIGYLGAAKLGLPAAVAQKVVSSAWPPSGVALAALLLLGLRYCLALPLCPFP